MYAFSVHEDVLVKHRLIQGNLVHEDQVQMIIEDDKRHSAWSDALRMIGRRSHSSKELEFKLRRKQYDPSQIREVIDRLITEKYIDDSDFAKQTAGQRIYHQKKGREWVKQELLYKGVDPVIVQQTISEIDQEAEKISCFKLALSKWKSSKEEIPDKKRKIISFLIRRGYSQSTVREVMNKLSESTITQEEPHYFDDYEIDLETLNEET